MQRSDSNCNTVSASAAPKTLGVRRKITPLRPVGPLNSNAQANPAGIGTPMPRDLPRGRLLTAVTTAVPEQLQPQRQLIRKETILMQRGGSTAPNIALASEDNAESGQPSISMTTPTSMATIGYSLPPPLAPLSGPNNPGPNESQAMERFKQSKPQNLNNSGAGRTQLMPGRATMRFRNMHLERLSKTPPQRLKLPPPPPTVRISNREDNIVISWIMEEGTPNCYAEYASYEIHAYEETSVPPLFCSGYMLGTVKALPLPIAVTLKVFEKGHRYYFSVRAVDIHRRFGPFSASIAWP